MAGIISLGIVIVAILIVFLLSWIIGSLYDIYYKYRVKRNHIKHPKMIELQKERERVCSEYNCWWVEKHEAQKRIDNNFEILKYCTEEVKKKYLASIEQDQQIYTNADNHMKELSPLVDAARKAEQTYREEHNIRHW